MEKISQSIDKIKKSYDVVIVGSGYGGSISASRLARAGMKVCLLERGKEFLPTEFPETLKATSKETQYDFADKKKGNNDALFDFRVNDEQSVLVGCGLGGTSLINANVVLKPHKEVFTNGQWPAEIVDDMENGVKDGYRRAWEMFGPNAYPNIKQLYKANAHFKSASTIEGAEVSFAPLNVTFTDRVNKAGVKQEACNNCGNCCSGCNTTAKNTTQMNYLPDAYNHSAQIFTGVKVYSIKKDNNKWNVYYYPTNTNQDDIEDVLTCVQADIVIISAGTLGTTEILLRSRNFGLPLSDNLGFGFSGNADFLGIAYNTNTKINGLGYLKNSLNDTTYCGPNITTLIDNRNDVKNYQDGICIEEGSIPVALAEGRLLPFSLLFAKMLIGRETFSDIFAEKYRTLKSLLLGSYHGAVNQTQIYLAMGHDGSDGRMYLENDRLRISWEGLGEKEIFKKINESLLKCTKALHGNYIQDPVWVKLFKNALVTVHPLGGSRMADTSRDGVVNHRSEAFSGNDAHSIHEGLYVMDGSMIPTSLGTNPLFTISAITERNCKLLVEKYNRPFID
ncbi:MAG TPA: GMC family oxidoreductase N-terminal domain-containing protein [Ignavibacteria bacterium]|nr:GMC family oxidoreductase N-terminal domain-containing protein [Ignavibacteria bacterium]